MADAETRQSWVKFLGEFKDGFYPLIAEHGLTFGEALLLWKLNEIYNVVCDLRDRGDE